MSLHSAGTGSFGLTGLIGAENDVKRLCQEIESAQQMLLKAICKAKKSIDTVANKSTDTVAENREYCSCDTAAGQCKRKRPEEDEFARGPTRAAQHRLTEHY
ncbi:hypothetical protein F2Q69_00011951 [Brassica cretica]|uniref:Uncharacterized protein n=1 Tax=Brassica cretica TaxID=69181 RepID=A0A8S9R6X7_BRACR|nr:hypothetical protein F2Q69_00011951 [Brassica cretica]